MWLHVFVNICINIHILLNVVLAYNIEPKIYPYVLCTHAVSSESLAMIFPGL